ncbi:MAG: substrate-binding domain-containing protein [Anaerolineaceae bacterium]
MSNKKFSLFLTIFILISLLAGCAPSVAPTAEPAAPAASTEAAAPAATEAPASATEAAPEATPTVVPTIRAGTPDRLILATTSSTQDSGLLDVLLPDFEKEFNTKVDVIAVGTGQALQLGKDGNADVLLVHARAQEDAFMADKHGTRREDVMYNDFVIIGPESDPAGIKGMTSAVDAFKKIAESQATFLSRGDKSGTHTKELSVWKAADITPEGDWYQSTGLTMGELLTMAEEQQGYALSDRATYLARTKNGLTLQVLVEKDKSLLNPYGVITVNPDKGPQVNTDLAAKFVDWIISVPVQEKIAEFGKADFGQSLFVPDSIPWKNQTAPAESGAALKVGGEVDSAMELTVDDLKGMELLKVEYTNKKGETNTYEGPLVSSVLEKAAVKASAATVTFVAADGYSADMAMADLTACADCIVAFQEDGGLLTVMPGQSTKLQVKDLVEIQVK